MERCRRIYDVDGTPWPGGEGLNRAQGPIHDSFLTDCFWLHLPPNPYWVTYPMQITYDPDRDILQIAFNNREVGETARISPNLILDYDDDGLIVGLEIRQASQRVESPLSVTYTIGPADLDKPPI